MGLLRESHDKANPPETPPKGWKTAKQWCAEEQISSDHGRRMIRGLVESGDWEMRKYRVETGRGIYPTQHYAPKGTKT